jgi:hypothetical protein
MREKNYIAEINFHDLTMFVLQNANFANHGTSVTDLSDQVGAAYLAVYNFFVEKYQDQERREEMRDIVPIGLEIKKLQ